MQEVDDLIATIIKKETCGIGIKPSMDRLRTKSEFFQILKLMEGHGTLINLLRFLAIIRFQFQMIGRNDDTAHVVCYVELPQFLKKL